MGMAAVAAGSALMANKASSDASKRASSMAGAANAQSQKQFQASQDEMKEAAEYLESMGVPSEEAQRIALQYAQVGPSAMEDIETDPRLQNAQMDALGKLQQMGGSGLTDSERAEQMMMQRSGAAQGQARDKSIMQNMAERGLGGSGMELAQRLQSSQSGADTAAMAQAQLSGQAQQRALGAISQAGQMGGQIRGQDFGEQANVASAKDRIAQFNEQNRASSSQQEEIHNKGLRQQQFENEMAKRKAVASARTGTAQAGMQRATATQAAGQAAAQGALQAGAAKSQLIGNLAGAGMKAYGEYNKKEAADGGVIGTSGYSEEQYEMGGVVGTPTYEEGGITMGQPIQQQGATSQAPNSNGGFAGGGIPVNGETPEMYEPELEGEIVPGDSFEDDRVDAKINSGEMVLNIEQQQRLMELLKGLRDLKGLGDEDIIASPEAAQGGVVGTSGYSEEQEYAMGGPVGTSGYNQEEQYENGGMVGEFTSDSDTYSSKKAVSKPRGLHASLDHERKSEDQSNVESKERKARIKAYETLANGGK